MLRFFHQLRRNLISENTRKYLLYALGEILLVMIGILLALQVNNWNQDRIKQNEEIEILNILQNDLMTARSQSLVYIKDEELDSLAMITVIAPDQLEELLDQGNPDSVVFRALWNLTMESPVISAYNDLKSSGKTGLITNQQIRERLASLEVNLNNMTTLLADRLSVQQIRIDDISSDQINFLQLMNGSRRNLPEMDLGTENDYRELFKDQRVRNLVAIKLELTFGSMTNRRALLKEINTILKLLEDEIKMLEA